MATDGGVTSSENREKQKRQTAAITIWTLTVLKQHMTQVTTFKLLNQKSKHGHHIDREFLKGHSGLSIACGLIFTSTLLIGSNLFSFTLLNEMLIVLSTRQLFHQPSCYEMLFSIGILRTNTYS